MKQMIRVAIEETNVFGALAYNARCLECHWHSRRFDKEQQAVDVAKSHRCEEK